MADGENGLSADTADSLLAASGLAKSFGETRALINGSISVRPGEVVAVMGENGSGKSTLVKIITGVLHPDAGTITLAGNPVSLRSPKSALDQGIVTVFQEILVAPALNVVDNICLGNRRLRDTAGARAERRSLAAELVDQLSPEPIDLDTPVGSLGLMEQQICVIARAIAHKPRVLILDEATSTLDVTVRDRLFDVVRGLCAAGTGVFFISHRMGEVMSLADRIMVLRSGQVVGTVQRTETTPDQLVKMMSGASVAIERTRRERVPTTDQPPVLAASLTLLQDSEPVDVRVMPGEIVGLAGLEGQGQEDFLRALAGLQSPREGSVEHRAKGDARTVSSYRRAVRDGIVYIPRDRKVEGLAGGLTVIDNFAMPTYERDGRFGMFSPARTRRRLQHFRQRLGLTAPGRRPAGRLSGGNQQKVVLARWLALDPRIVLLNDPTRGVDHATKHEVYDLLEELAEDGVAVVMVSTEVEEHLALMDRTLVFRGGVVTAEFKHGEVDRDGLVAAFFGHRATIGSVES